MYSSFLRVISFLHFATPDVKSDVQDFEVNQINSRHSHNCCSFYFSQGVTVQFTKKVYSGTEDKPDLPEIVISGGDITEPTIIT